MPFAHLLLHAGPEVALAAAPAATAATAVDRERSGTPRK